MKLNLSEMAIKEMDHDEVRVQLMDLREKGTTADVIMDVLRKVISSYEKKKTEVLEELINQAYIDIVSQIWEDPLDSFLYQRQYELKSIAETLNIEINASKK